MEKRKISHYRLVEVLGQGAMGVVYRARDERLDRDVALKLLPAEAMGNADARRRLEHEARIASSLNHPHICTIFDVGESEGQLYLAMELVAGEPLSRAIIPEGLPEATVVRLGVQLADALAHAHRHGVIHRDLKSSNVMVSPEGRAKILDFGLALRHAEAPADATRSNADAAMAGTLAYMAPETLRGQPADAGSDVWGLGTILYEMAAGHRPFQAVTGYELTSAILRDAPAPLPARLSPGVAAIIRRCLEKHPGQRYQSAAELRAALEAVAVPSSVTPGVVRASKKRAVGLAALLASAALLVIGLLIALNGFKLRDYVLARGVQKITSIAVLPLENLSGDSSQDYFSDGMTEALISDLAQIRALKVISRTSVMAYKGSRKSLPQIARELGVDGVVEGSVARSGNRVRVTAQLIYAATDTHLWAREYERDISDVLKLQNELARSICDEIRVQVTPTERQRLAAAKTVDPAAHEAYLLGRYFWNQRTDEGLMKSVQFFQEAIERDPGYALAYVGLADSYSILAGYTLPPYEAFPRAKAAALKALELDPDSAEAHASAAMIFTIYDWNWNEGGKQFQRVLELNPSYATGHHWYGHYLMFLGRFNEALEEMKRAREMDPLSPIINVEVGYPSFFARRYDDAIRDYRKALELTPDFFRAHWLLGQAYEQKAMYPEALAELQKAVELSHGNLVMNAALGHALAVSGKTGEARKTLASLLETRKRRYVSSYFIAEIYAALGQKRDAVVWLQTAHQEHDYFMRWLKIDPRLDGLRAEPGFQELERSMNFPP